MNTIEIDINVAKGIVEALNQLQLDYANSKARNAMVDHVLESMQNADRAEAEEQK